MITPELAAFVVKEYLLPMFESDGKRLMSKKLQSTQGKRSKSPEADFDIRNNKDIEKLMRPTRAFIIF